MSDSQLDLCIPRLTVLVSGTGSTLHSILLAQQEEALNAHVYHVIANKKNIPALDNNILKEKGIKIKIPVASMAIWDKKEKSRQDYDKILAKIIFKHKPDLIILAGFMHILSQDFFYELQNLYGSVNQYTPKIINLHPALPGQFPGANGIKDAYYAFKRGEITYTGSMVHEVIPEVDAGECIVKNRIPIYPTDTLKTLETRMKYHEKGLILQAIQFCLSEIQDNVTSQLSINMSKPYLLYKGKVRDIWNLGYQRLALVTSDRTSSFDRHITDVPNKGSYLTQISAWWFAKTQNIIPNHMIFTKGNVMIVKKCQVIPIEVVVRAYITGSTKTSLWTHYEKGIRKYCGIDFPEGLQKNQKLPKIVVTPTTKGEKEDIPVSPYEITKTLKLITKSQYNYIETKAIQLFEYVAKKVDKIGFILVDTKLEFGIDSETNEIILIDEIFTPDSSRFWDKEYYENYLKDKNKPPKNPKNFDKDLIRNYVKSKIQDPYSQEIPIIPIEIIHQIQKAYDTFFDALYNMDYIHKYNPIHTVSANQLPHLFESYFLNQHSPSALVITDTKINDSEYLRTLLNQLKDQNIYTILEVIKTPLPYKGLSNLLEEYEEDIHFHRLNRNRMVAITCIYHSFNNFLTQMVSQELSIPVINCPQTNKIDEIPEGIPVATIPNPVNCAKFVKKIIKTQTQIELNSRQSLRSSPQYHFNNLN